jgi:hypothetical protein
MHVTSDITNDYTPVVVRLLALARGKAIPAGSPERPVEADAISSTSAAPLLAINHR